MLLKELTELEQVDYNRLKLNFSVCSVIHYLIFYPQTESPFSIYFVSEELLITQIYRAGTSWDVLSAGC